MTHRAPIRAQPDAAAAFAVGTLVRCVNPHHTTFGMTGTVVGIVCGIVTVQMTAWNVTTEYVPTELVAVERGGR